MKKKSQGFTLIEMVIVLALTVIILAIICSVLIGGNRVFSDSDVKSTLQMEAEAIQENVSKIGMQSIGIDSIADEEGKKSINDTDEFVGATAEELQPKLTDIDGKKNTNELNNKWLSINSITMNSYNGNDDFNPTITQIPIIECKKDKVSSNGTFTILVDGKELSRNVKSVRIKYNDVAFKDANSILMNIELSKKAIYSDITYPISIEVKFRNKDNY